MRQKKSQKQLKYIWLLFLLPISSYAVEDVYLTAKAGTYTFDVDNNGTSSLSGVGAYALDIGYHLGRNFVLSVVFNALYADGIAGDQGFGFDIAIKHYPVSTFGFEKIEDEQLDLSVADIYRPYYGTAFRQREFLIILSTSYLGPSVFFGLDYQWKNDWYLNAEFRYDLLQGSGEATATQTNILFGLGRNF